MRLAKSVGTRLALGWLTMLVVSVPPALAEPEMVMQVLEPTGGKILRPADWYYQERHAGPSWNWVISQEEPSNGYETGVSIQVFMGVEERTGSNVRELLERVAKVRAKEAVEVLSLTDHEDHGLFTVFCVETVERQGDQEFRVYSSFFYASSGADLAAVMVFGAPRERWDELASVRTAMGTFELIDMSRFE